MLLGRAELGRDGPQDDLAALGRGQDLITHNVNVALKAGHCGP
jgi:hypothetical protein